MIRLAYFCLAVYTFSFSIFFLKLDVIAFPGFSVRGYDFAGYSFALAVHALLTLLLYKRSVPLNLFISTGLLLRLVALFCEPFTTDVYRFLSDGLNLISGNNPYLAEPAVAETDFFEMKSMYGIALWPYFSAGALLGKLVPANPLLAFKLLAGISELAILIYYTRRSRNRWLLAALWTSPLLVFENWHEGHLEMAALVPLLLAFEIFKRRGASGTALWLAAISAAIKLQGFLLLVWFRFFPRRFAVEFHNRRSWLSVLKFDAVWLAIFIALNLSLLPTLFFQGQMPGPESGLAMYWATWQHSQPWLTLGATYGLPQEVSIRVLQFLMAGGCTSLLLARLYRRIDASALLAGWLGCFVLFFPVQHPWYYQLLLLYVLNFRRYRLAGLLLMTLVGMNYLTYTPALQGNIWPQVLVWGLSIAGGICIQGRESVISPVRY